MKNEIVLFTDGDANIEVQISPDEETVWLTQKQMGILFQAKQATISEHITNILKTGELDETSIGFSDKSSGGRKPKIYNLDMILSVGYRVNSKRGIAFRRWANFILKQYTIQGYALNNKRLKALMLLDQYDHQTIIKPAGSKPIYRLTYENCRKMVDSMEDTFKSDVFGIEKEAGMVKGIIDAVYQSAFGEDAYSFHYPMI